MCRFDHEKYFGRSRNFEPLRICETKGFDLIFFQNKTSPSNAQSRRKGILQSYYITLFQQLRQDPPKLMIPHESSNS